MNQFVTTPIGSSHLTLSMIATQIKGTTVAPEAVKDKWRLLDCVIEARGHLNLSLRSVNLLEKLVAFHPKRELSGGECLVVFASNKLLAKRLGGCSESTIKRCIKELVKAGIIARRDSPNGKRYAVYDKDGKVKDAFGLSLLPLLARADELEKIAADVALDAAKLKSLERQLSVLRRDVGELVKADVSNVVFQQVDTWREHHRCASVTLRKGDRLTVAKADIDMESLRNEIVEALKSVLPKLKVDGNAGQNEPHIESQKPESLLELEPGAEEKQGESVAPQPKTMREPLKAFPLEMVLRASPDIVDYGQAGRIENWRDLMSAAVLVRSMLGVSPSAYQKACQVMGPENAAVAMACILQRAGHIRNPGGYLCDLTEKAARGEFSVSSMLMALLKARRGEGLKAGC